MPQTSVDDMTVAVPGLLADNAMVKDAVSRFSEEATAGIPFGVMVAHGTDDQGVELLGAISDKLEGVVVFNHGYARPHELDTDGLQPGALMSVLRKGRIWVQVEEAVTPASAVLVRAVAAGMEQAGAFRDTADASDCIDISGFAKYLTSADAGGLAVLEIDMTNASEKAADS